MRRPLHGTPPQPFEIDRCPGQDEAEQVQGPSTPSLQTENGQAAAELAFAVVVYFPGVNAHVRRKHLRSDRAEPGFAELLGPLGGNAGTRRPAGGTPQLGDVEPTVVLEPEDVLRRKNGELAVDRAWAPCVPEAEVVVDGAQSESKSRRGRATSVFSSDPKASRPSCQV
jgi:hypothetical protein